MTPKLAVGIAEEMACRLKYDRAFFQLPDDPDDPELFSVIVIERLPASCYAYSRFDDKQRMAAIGIHFENNTTTELFRCQVLKAIRALESVIEQQYPDERADRAKLIQGALH